MLTDTIIITTTIESLIQHCGKMKKSLRNIVFQKRKIKDVKNHYWSPIKKLYV